MGCPLSELAFLYIFSTPIKTRYSLLLGKKQKNLYEIETIIFQLAVFKLILSKHHHYGNTFQIPHVINNIYCLKPSLVGQISHIFLYFLSVWMSGSSLVRQTLYPSKVAMQTFWSLTSFFSFDIGAATISC